MDAFATAVLSFSDEEKTEYCSKLPESLVCVPNLQKEHPSYELSFDTWKEQRFEDKGDPIADHFTGFVFKDGTFIVAISGNNLI